MSCLSTADRQWYQTRLDKLQTQLEALDDAIDNGTLHVEMASLDTGEGKQTMKYKSLEEMFDQQKRLETRIRRFQNIINGTGIVSMNLRRKNGS